MTLSEKVAEMEPNKVNKYRAGGVAGCPNDYPYLNDDRNSYDCGCRINNENCTKCWNRPFVELTNKCEGCKHDIENEEDREECVHCSRTYSDCYEKEEESSKETNTNINLCDRCVYCFAECGGAAKFGNGVGNDNVVECDLYREDE